MGIELCGFPFPIARMAVITQCGHKRVGGVLGDVETRDICIDTNDIKDSINAQYATGNKRNVGQRPIEDADRGVGDKEGLLREKFFFRARIGVDSHVGLVFEEC